MNGFLVRADGALVAIDHILYVQKEPLPGGEHNVKVYLTGEISVQWNQEPVMEKTADFMLAEIRRMLQEAIKF